METWKFIEGFDRYEISNKGNLRVNLKYRKYRSYNCKILNPIVDKDGYYRTVLIDNQGNAKMKIIHRLVAQEFLDNEFNYPVVNHINGIKSDNNYYNLEWCTVRHNNVHAIELGLKKPLKREFHNLAKLKEQDILDIRANVDNLFQWQLGLVYGVEQSQISRIMLFKRWK